VLAAKGLEKSYKGKKVVKSVNLEVHKGETVGLLGPNGAGKTTTFYMIVGIIPLDNGSVYLGDNDITALSMYKRANYGLGYLPQEPSIFRKLTVEENLLAILQILNLPEKEIKEIKDSLLEEFKLEKIAKTKGYQLSGGERRRAEIARALIRKPEFLLLDEPFTGIDPIRVNDIQEIVTGLKEKGIGVLITDHKVKETLEIVDRAYMLNEGQIFASGNSKELSENPIARKIYLGDKFKLDN